jgi:hypothetical protein
LVVVGHVRRVLVLRCTATHEKVLNFKWINGLVFRVFGIDLGKFLVGFLNCNEKENWEEMLNILDFYLFWNNFLVVLTVN